MTEQEKKWFWMMDYCKNKQIPPAQSWAWDKAAREYSKTYNDIQCRCYNFYLL